MPKNHMPVAHFGARPDDVRAEAAPPKAIDRWRPEICALAGDKDAAAETVIDILDVIGETWDGLGATSAKVADKLRAAGDRDVVVNINSPGGDFFEGLSIYNLLRVHKGSVTVRVMGMAASAASVIAMAGDRIEIARAGFLMIHNVWVFAVGDRHDLTAIADQLAAFDEVAADLYARRSGVDQVEIAGMLDRETWISGAKAVESGFADALLSSDLVGVNAAALDARDKIRAIAKMEGAMARGGLPRSERRHLIKEITSTPSAADDGMPSAAVSLTALMGSVDNFLAK